MLTELQEKHFTRSQILEAYDRDNCVIFQSWKFDNIRLRPNRDIVFETLVICLFGIFEFYFFLQTPELAL